METKIDMTGTTGAEPFMERPLGKEPAPRIKPVEPGEKGASREEQESGRPAAREKSFVPMRGEEVKGMVDEAQSLIEDLNIRLNFEVNEGSGDLVVRVVNRDTEEVVRQIPSEELVKLREKLVELRGILLDDKV